MAFAVLSLSQLVYAFNTRSEHSLSPSDKKGALQNKKFCNAPFVCPKGERGNTLMPRDAEDFFFLRCFAG